MRAKNARTSSAIATAIWPPSKGRIGSKLNTPMKKFKLAIKYLMMIKKNEFTIDYFTLAIRSGAFYIGFYLYQKYENEII